MSQLQENTYFAGRYKLLNKLGSGGFSVVWLAEDTMAGNTKIALKIYAPDKGLDKDGIDNFRKEYAITLNLNHSSLLSAKHFDVADGSPYLIMQFLSNGSALKLVENIDEKRLGKFIFQVSSGLEYLHAHEPPIVHQDIKPDNVLISGKGDFLLTDFGISTRVRRTLTKSAAKVGYSGTIAYVPPERYMRNPKPQPEGDIFAFGIMLFEIMTGYLPWNEQGGLGFIGSQIIPPVDAEGFSDAIKNLCVACISFKPEDRPLASEIRLYAQHYVQQGFWDIKYRPDTVGIVEISSQQEAQKRTQDALKQQALETERKKAKELEAVKQKEILDAKAREQEKQLLIDDDNARKAKEKLQQKRKDEETKRLRKQEVELKFSEIITNADNKFNSGSFNESLKLYKAALKLKDDVYVKSRIEDCSTNLMKQKEERKRNDELKYVQNISNQANMAFNNGNYKDAKKNYTILVNKNNEDFEAQSRLKEIEAISSQMRMATRRKIVKLLIPLSIIVLVGAGVYWYLNKPLIPHANFTADKLSAKVGEQITFMNKSENANKLQWNFVGGMPEKSSDENPQVVYTKAGEYTIELLASNADGKNVKVKNIYISVLNKIPEQPIPMPKSDFYADKTSVVSGKTIKFNSKAKNADSVSWSFENGNPSSSSKLNPKVRYSKPGKYKVTLIAYNSEGKDVKTRNKYITVSKDIKKPIAEFEADVSTIYVGEYINFYDHSSFALSRNWSFPGGNPSESSIVNPEVVYNQVGTYSVELEVRNEKGEDRVSKEMFIEVLENPAVAMQKKFNQLVDDADYLFDKELLEKALQKYIEANDIKQGDTHVNNRISVINKILNTKTAFNNFISKGDNYFNQKEYENAKEQYQLALKAKPGEKYPQEKIRQINLLTSADNIAFAIPISSIDNSKQILVSISGKTAVVSVKLGKVYKDNKVKIIISALWSDKKSRPINEVDEQIAIVDKYVRLSSSKLSIANFKNTKYLAFSNTATLKLIADKNFEGGKVKVSINLKMFLGELGMGVPNVVNYSNKNPAGSLDIEFDMNKYYKSK
jgi:PKD repeat protein